MSGLRDFLVAELVVFMPVATFCMIIITISLGRRR